ncbi:MAG: 2-polyprenyl-3-methyl-6-methoxy-1,4-benzoquinone monooxygenase [Burkholderiales bacterium]|nr:2-polyprenyl-3-methyl-6-methoxy-1,4-benzoquinone monooxygenase [Burkholderiales bacterium]
MSFDRLIVPLDRALRTLFATPHTSRPEPGAKLPEGDLDASERRLAGSLMRVNHTGEVCAQALYEGQMLVAREPRVQTLLEHAAREETEHLAWTAARLQALGARRSVLDPLFYGGSLALGAAAGLLGDRWSLGFLAETERQVEQHLSGHMERLPAADARSRAVVEQMRADEAGHAMTAEREGAARLPLPARLAMRLAARIMTGTTRYL